MNESGKSKSKEFPYGKRTIKHNKELAPRSLRRKHYFLSECSEKELEKAKIR